MPSAGETEAKCEAEMTHPRHVTVTNQPNDQVNFEFPTATMCVESMTWMHQWTNQKSPFYSICMVTS